MSRPYSGNVADFSDAVANLGDMGFKVLWSHYYSPMQQQDVAGLIVLDDRGCEYANKEFAVRDSDLMYIKAASFLNELTEVLRTWS